MLHLTIRAALTCHYWNSTWWSFNESTCCNNVQHPGRGWGSWFHILLCSLIITFRTILNIDYCSNMLDFGCAIGWSRILFGSSANWEGIKYSRCISSLVRKTRWVQSTQSTPTMLTSQKVMFRNVFFQRCESKERWVTLQSWDLQRRV